jgi:outer membrane receptor protein involved in Fe transport
LNKGFDLGSRSGVLNASFEHARSFSNAASPHTAYQRNILSLNYMNIFMRETTPLTLNIGLTGNIGGYNAEADPDNELDDYSKSRDNNLRAHFELNWLLNKKWITNLSLRGSLSTVDRKSEDYTHTNSATTLANLHAMEEGYFIATNYDSNPNAPIILGPTGYWHVKQFNDSKPINGSLRLKADWTRRFDKMMSRLMLGAEYTGSRNNGQGSYYDDLRYAPTWREYRYDDLPALNNIALYAEEKVSIPTSKLSTLEITAGLRDDITIINGSEYGTVSSLSPRFNGRYTFWKNRRKRVVSELVLHAGWGKSVKLPSFQVLYPSPSYYDIEVFRSPSTANNTTVSAWYTRPSKALYNPDLKWQYTNQTDIGIEMNIKGTRVSLSAFHHRTYNPYMATTEYTPFSYYYTPVSALEGLTIPTDGRTYTIDPTTGTVTVSSADGSSAVVPNNERRFYLSNTRYINASPLDRYGLEWIIDFKQFKALNTSLRFDGNYYYYKSEDETLFASMHNSNTKMTGTGEPYQYIGWYRGTNGTSTAQTSIANGAISKTLNLNTTITTHIPKIRLIMALRIESTLYSYRKNLSNFEGDVYPEYYTTWDAPDTKIPFAEKFQWAKDNDATLYNDLQNLVVHPNTAYVMNANRISAYYSANLSVTKEIGDHVSISFYANNFFNNMKTVHSSQTDLDASLFSSSYIPSYYYGLSLRLKL